jgi:hypothetical protein
MIRQTRFLPTTISAFTPDPSSSLKDERHQPLAGLGLLHWNDRHVRLAWRSSAAPDRFRGVTGMGGFANE